MKIHYLQHIEFEGLGIIENWAKENNCEISFTKFYNGELPPSEINFDLLVIMGGPMNIYEEDVYPWLKAEKTFIKETIKAGKKVLGVCLGAQLITDILGAKVVKNKEKEIGWFDIEKLGESKMFSDFPNQLKVLHWHGDSFEIPNKAERVFKSETCENQAFIYDERVIALQFHFEMTKSGIEKIIENSQDELSQKGKYIQNQSELIKEDYIKESNKLMYKLLDKLKG